MPETQSKTIVGLKWDESLRMTATHKGLTWTLDADNEAGPSPVVALASALAGCMAIDVVHILSRGRHKVGSLTATFTGERADSEPRRFTRIDLLFTVETDASVLAVERAIELSHEKYCSVWHSMRQDIAFHTGVDIHPLGSGGSD